MTTDLEDGNWDPQIFGDSYLIVNNVKEGFHDGIVLSPDNKMRFSVSLGS